MRKGLRPPRYSSHLSISLSISPETTVVRICTATAFQSVVFFFRLSPFMLSPPYIMHYTIGFTICQEVLYQYFVFYPLSHQHLVDNSFLCKRKAPSRMLNLVFVLCLAPFPLCGNCGSDSGSLALPCWSHC